MSSRSFSRRSSFHGSSGFGADGSSLGVFNDPSALVFDGSSVGCLADFERFEGSAEEVEDSLAAGFADFNESSAGVFDDFDGFADSLAGGFDGASVDGSSGFGGCVEASVVPRVHLALLLVLLHPL
jgi:hypothetical protein